MPTRKRSVLLVSSLVVTGILVTSFALWVRAVQWQHTIDRQLIEAVVNPADWDDSQMSLALLKVGADPNCRVNELPPPTFVDLLRQILHLASPPVNNNPTALMIACGAEWESSKGDHYWRASSNSALVKAMLARPVRIDARTGKEQTALMYACTYRDASIVSLLLQDGASPNLQNSDGETALHLAVRNLHSDTITLLLRYHADINHKNGRGTTPLGIAYQNSHTPASLIRFLEQARATR